VLARTEEGVSYLIANIIPALAIWSGMSGIPLWLVVKRRHAADVVAQPAARSAAALPADRALPAEAELLRAHSHRIRAQRRPVPERVPVTASR
jgi:hypothetical protein